MVIIKMDKCLSGKFFNIPNKFWEIQLSSINERCIDIMFKLNNKDDHAGLHIRVQLGKIFLCFSVYDSRHWDWENDCWMEVKDEN
jgi:hypothetical protein